MSSPFCKKASTPALVAGSSLAPAGGHGQGPGPGAMAGARARAYLALARAGARALSYLTMARAGARARALAYLAGHGWGQASQSRATPYCRLCSLEMN